MPLIITVSPASAGCKVGAAVGVDGAEVGDVGEAVGAVGAAVGAVGIITEVSCATANATAKEVVESGMSMEASSV